MGRPRRVRGPPDRIPVGWGTAAGGAGPRSGARAGPDHARRAGGRPRSSVEGPVGARAVPADPPGRGDRPVRHPRSGRGLRHRRPGGNPAPRQDPAGQHPRGAMETPGHGVRGPLPRVRELRRCAGGRGSRLHPLGQDPDPPSGWSPPGGHPARWRRLESVREPGRRRRGHHIRRRGDPRGAGLPWPSSGCPDPPARVRERGTKCRWRWTPARWCPCPPRRRRRMAGSRFADRGGR